MSNEITEAVEEIRTEMVGNDVIVNGEAREILAAKAFCRDATGDLIPRGAAIAQRGKTPEHAGIGVEVEGEGYVTVQEFGDKLESGEWEEPR